MSVKVKKLFERRKQRVRFALRKSAKGRIRLTVFRSNQHIYAQLVDDSKGVTVASASTTEKEISSKLKSKSNKLAAEEVGKLIAKRGKEAKVGDVVFDRGGHLYHGCMKALADAARQAGLSF